MIKKIVSFILLFHLLSSTCYAEYTYKEWRDHELKKLRISSMLADYMYNRIKFYQEIDDYWERLNIFWAMYKILQKMEFK